ncbi:MAG: aminoglycoside 6-adenylyltransferase [Candidatus Omnitrophica bacterium]|nr:aminoglycoside 6-adenylyltransferase [Candidatus Omnitrophota bacterium]
MLIDHPLYKPLISNLLSWAQEEPDIRAILVWGSTVRSLKPGAPGADLDLVIIAKQPHHYLDTAEWLANIGDSWLALPIRQMLHGEKRKALVHTAVFDERTILDFAFCSPTAVRIGYFGTIMADNLPFLGRLLPTSLMETTHIFARIFRLGHKVLLDKDNWSWYVRRLTSLAPRSPMPSQAQFHYTISQFFRYALCAATFQRRKETWSAIHMLSCLTTGPLLQMLRWHAQAIQGEEVETWWQGKFIEDWVDKTFLEMLPGLFPRYDSTEIQNALVSNLCLFDNVSQETAKALGFSYPMTMADKTKLAIQNP